MCIFPNGEKVLSFLFYFNFILMNKPYIWTGVSGYSWKSRAQFDPVTALKSLFTDLKRTTQHGQFFNGEKRLQVCSARSCGFCGKAERRTAKGNRKVFSATCEGAVSLCKDLGM